MTCETVPPQVLPKRTGAVHVVEAAGYSAGGLRRLLKEAAFRHEIVLGAALLAILVACRAPLLAFAAQAVLLLVLAAFEAANTAVELIVDRLSPEWSIFARDAKDLGSLAVACLVIANVGCTLTVLFLV